ncbi:MAG: hypothetical protein RLZZ297_1870, partial [Chloroflexota bacterium]
STLQTTKPNHTEHPTVGDTGSGVWVRLPAWESNRRHNPTDFL